MTSKPAKVHTPMADRPVRQRPVRVKLTRADAYIAATCPPDGEAENWWPRLNEALGTMSSDFVDASLLQLQAAARSPFGTISQTAMNAALAMITAAAPRDEIEAALAIQMACTHTAVMSILSKLDSGFGTERRIAAFGSAAARLMRTYAMQVEVLRRLRSGGHQYVRVEHVHVNSGGQAVVGVVEPPEGGAKAKNKDQPHALGHAPGEAMRSPHEERETLPVPSDGERALPDAQRPVSRRAKRQ